MRGKNGICIGNRIRARKQRFHNTKHLNATSDKLLATPSYPTCGSNEKEGAVQRISSKDDSLSSETECVRCFARTTAPFQARYTSHPPPRRTKIPAHPKTPPGYRAYQTPPNKNAKSISNRGSKQPLDELQGPSEKWPQTGWCRLTCAGENARESRRARTTGADLLFRAVTRSTRPSGFLVDVSISPTCSIHN